MALPTIPKQEWTVQIGLEASLESHWGQALERLGKFAESVPHLKKAYDLYCTDVPRNLREEAWCAENLGDGYGSMNNFKDALAYKYKARDHWLDWAKDNDTDKTVWPAILKRGMGNNLIWARESQLARDVLDQGLAQLEAATPYNWAMVA